MWHHDKQGLLQAGGNQLIRQCVCAVLETRFLGKSTGAKWCEGTTGKFNKIEEVTHHCWVWQSPHFWISRDHFATTNYLELPWGIWSKSHHFGNPVRSLKIHEREKTLNQKYSKLPVLQYCRGKSLKNNEPDSPVEIKNRNLCAFKKLSWASQSKSFLWKNARVESWIKACSHFV